MNELWTKDSKQILYALNSVAERSVSFAIQQKGRFFATKALKLHVHKGKEYLIMERPEKLVSSLDISSILYKVKGLPVLGFKVSEVKASEKFLATLLPCEIFLVQRRRHTRYIAPKGSIATFFLPSRQRPNVCMLQDISMGGVKLHGGLNNSISKKDMIGPCTLTLTGYESLITRQVTLQSSYVVRNFAMRNGKVELGLRFDLNTDEEELLGVQLDYLAVRSPFPLRVAPFYV